MSRSSLGRFCLQFLALACVFLVAAPSYGQGDITNFTGGDPGEGLDLDGDFVYAVNIGDDNPPSPYVVNDVEFTSDLDTDGFEFFSTHEIRDNWAQPQYGGTDNDIELEDVMRTIRWSQSPSAVEIDMDVETGQSYKLQMMFTESCCNRAFDIFVEDELLLEDFAIHENHIEWDGVGNWNIDSRDNGVLITHEFVAEDDALNIELGGDTTAPDYPDNNGHISALTLEVGVDGVALQAGDADQDCDFDQLDLVKVQVAGKYLSGEAATWGEGDWDAAPGGELGSPPPGDGKFDQLDIIAALNAGLYLQPPYCDPGGLAALAGPGGDNDDQTSIVYNANTGEVAVNAPASKNLTSVNIDSASGIFVNSGNAQNLDGSFDTSDADNIFKATFGSSFGSLSFGEVAMPGLSEDVVAADLTVIGSLEGGGGLGEVDLIYIPEPSSLILLGLGLAAAALLRPRRRS